MSFGNAIDRQEVLYNDGDVVLSRYDGMNVINAYKRTDYAAPLSGKQRNGWLCCGTWKRVIPGFRETEVYGREPKTVKTLEDIAATVKGVSA